MSTRDERQRKAARGLADREPSALELRSERVNDNGTGNRLISRAEAAKYCGISTSRFSQWVTAGVMPMPIRGTRRWDRIAIERVIDARSALNDNKKSGFAAWRSGKKELSE